MDFKLFLNFWYENFSTLGLVDPMMLYGFEILGYENLNVIERVHPSYFNAYFNLKTVQHILREKTGRFPLYMYIKVMTMNLIS